MITLDTEPGRGEHFVYLCPLSGRENSFAYDDAASPKWNSSGRAAHGSVTGRKVLRS